MREYEPKPCEFCGLRIEKGEGEYGRHKSWGCQYVLRDRLNNIRTALGEQEIRKLLGETE